MDFNQLSELVLVLDREQRADHNELGQLRQQLEALAVERADDAKRIAALEAELAATRAQVEQLLQLQAYFEHFKEQINQFLERSEARRQQAWRESEQLRQAEMDQLNQAVGELRREVDTYRRFDEEIAARRADYQRVVTELANLREQLAEASKEREEWQKVIALFEEMRRKDIQRFNDLPVQLAELAKRIDGILPRLQYLEQFPPRLTEIKTALEELRQLQNKDLEKLQFLEVQYERQIKSWTEETNAFRQRAAEYEKRIEQYAEQYQFVRKSAESLRAFQDQIERTQNEMSELQRLALNRQKLQLEEWQAAQEQRWQKYLNEWERHWSDYDKALGELTARVLKVEKELPAYRKHWQTLLQVIEEDAQARASAAQEWQARFEQLIEQE